MLVVPCYHAKLQCITSSPSNSGFSLRESVEVQLYLENPKGRPELSVFGHVCSALLSHCSEHPSPCSIFPGTSISFCSCSQAALKSNELK